MPTRVKVDKKKQLLDRIGKLKSFKMLLKALEEEPEGSHQRVEVNFSYEPLPLGEEWIEDTVRHGKRSYTREIEPKDSEFRKKVEKDCKSKDLDTTMDEWGNPIFTDLESYKKKAMK